MGVRDVSVLHAGRAYSLLAGAIVAFGTLLSAQSALAEESRWGKSYLPNVDVTDQDRRPLKFYDDLIKGKIVVFSFVYTSCSSICPLTVARLAEVHETLGEAMGREIYFVSISIDPIPDTPEKLKEYAGAFKIGPGWSFITGAPENIDLIRYKLGERSGEAIAQHKNEVLMFNDATGEWARNSAFADLGVLAMTIRSMEPKWRNAARPIVSRETGGKDLRAVADGPGQALFIKACATCHTVGQGDKVGPDLAGLTKRRDADWIKSYLMSPAKLRSNKDPIALDLQKKYPAVRMPNLGLADTDVADLLSYLENHNRAAADAIR